MNENPDLPLFLDRFHPPFPVGIAGGAASLEYLQWPSNERPLVPMMVFIDRKGIIRAEYTGKDEEFFNDARQDRHIRDLAEKLLAEKTTPSRAKGKRRAK